MQWLLVSSIFIPWATQGITQILKNYDQISKRSNSGSRRALEELKKKENHQNLMAKMIVKLIQDQ